MLAEESSAATNLDIGHPNVDDENASPPPIECQGCKDGSPEVATVTGTIKDSAAPMAIADPFSSGEELCAENTLADDSAATTSVYIDPPNADDANFNPSAFECQCKEGGSSEAVKAVSPDNTASTAFDDPFFSREESWGENLFQTAKSGALSERSRKLLALVLAFILGGFVGGVIVAFTPIVKGAANQGPSVEKGQDPYEPRDNKTISSPPTGAPEEPEVDKGGATPGGENIASPGGTLGDAVQANVTDTETQAIVPSSNVSETDTAALPVPQVDADDLEYRPGDLKVMKKGVLLSNGLDVDIIAQSGQGVLYGNGTRSTVTFHGSPDFGACFPVPVSDTMNPGGWVYVSNSEIKFSQGGVGALTFDKDGRVVDYKMLLEGTSMNCGGGATPWQTWISCEEKTGSRDGQIYEVDPFGRKEARMTVLGGRRGGAFESFAYHVQDKSNPRFFVTEDQKDGSIRRFTPNNEFINWTDPTDMLHQKGKMEYLILNNKKGAYSWTTNRTEANRNARRNYRNCEGIDVADGKLYFVSKVQNEMFILDLDGKTYVKESTKSGTFSGSPDQLVRLIGEGDILYFTEEGGGEAGVHGRDSKGRYFTILESPVYLEETTGLAFSPDGKHMYVAYQKNGLLLHVWRKDGLPFFGRSINVKYHNTEETGITR